MQTLPILFRDDHFVAVHKPPGLLVHRSPIARAEQFALQCLRDQLDRRVYPIHRLDRPTSGVLLFGLSREAARALSAEFLARRVDKTYLAVVRGYTDAAGRVDYALAEDRRRPLQPAVTAYRRLATLELPIAVGRYPSARYSLVEVYPETGRMHQIRKHFAHIFHPVIGDTTHGEARHNRVFRDCFGLHRLLLVATGLGFRHPVSGASITIQAAPEPELGPLLARFGSPGPGSP